MRVIGKLTGTRLDVIILILRVEMAKSIAEINERVRKGQAVVVTALK